uniref:Uncharacterized protein n=1 Tax=Arundo donax TaxID=35708 RepID=A0A0A9ENE5_ARUDO
MGPFLFLSH